MTQSIEQTNQQRDGAGLTLIKGVLVGIANIIPGVSGGTFALILGIFDRMVGALNALGLGTVKLTLRFVAKGFRGQAKDEFLEEMRRVDVIFLILLCVGAGVAIASTTFLLEYLLVSHYSPTLAFFIGLILPSIAVPWAMMDRRGIVMLWVIPGIALTVGVSFLMPDGSAGTENPLVAAGVGAIVVSAMILPGLSGSYLMLVMGQYQNAISKVTTLLEGLAHLTVDFGALGWIAAFVVGVVLGIILFARLLHLLLDRFRSVTLAFLIGLLIGSLWVLWPFKDLEHGAAIEDRSGEVKQEIRIATAPNRMPDSAGEGLIAGGAFVVGLVGSAGLLALGRRRKQERGDDPSE